MASACSLVGSNFSLQVSDWVAGNISIFTGINQIQSFVKYHDCVAALFITGLKVGDSRAFC